MVKNYSELLRAANNRYNPEGILLEKSFREKLNSVSYSDLLSYLRVTMNAVDPEYTKKCKEAGNNAREHLKKELSSVSYEYQGSVLSDTHIRAHSDIDLLVISEKFYGVDYHTFKEIVERERDLKESYDAKSIDKVIEEYNRPRYPGNAISDLKELRLDSERILSSIYKNCDISKGKAIKITNKNLHRDVDIVISNWFDDVGSIVNDKGVYRGIQIYDKETNSRSDADYPFIKIEKINSKSSETEGRLKKMIRFLKNVKADSDRNINLSSFDISCICYDIEVSLYENRSYKDLVSVLYNNLDSLVEDESKRNNLKSIDGREYIFRNNQDKQKGLENITIEVGLIYKDLIAGGFVS